MATTQTVTGSIYIQALLDKLAEFDAAGQLSEKFCTPFLLELLHEAASENDPDDEYIVLPMNLIKERYIDIQIKGNAANGTVLIHDVAGNIIGVNVKFTLRQAYRFTNNEPNMLRIAGLSSDPSIVNYNFSTNNVLIDSNWISNGVINENDWQAIVNLGKIYHEELVNKGNSSFGYEKGKGASGLYLTPNTEIEDFEEYGLPIRMEERLNTGKGEDTEYTLGFTPEFPSDRLFCFSIPQRQGAAIGGSFRKAKKVILPSTQATPTPKAAPKPVTIKVPSPSNNSSNSSNDL